MARLKCSMRTAVFFTSEEYTSEPTIGQKGTFLPSSWAMPSASAVFPVPGAPARTQSRPQQLQSQAVMLTWRLCLRCLVWKECRQREGRLTCKKERPACHLLQLDHLHYETACFPRLVLANKSLRRRHMMLVCDVLSASQLLMLHHESYCASCRPQTDSDRAPSDIDLSDIAFISRPVHVTKGMWTVLVGPHFHKLHWRMLWP